MTISPQLLKILVCPVTKDKLIYDEDSNTLISLSAGLAYPIMDGIPIMLIDKAIKVSPKKLKDFLDREQSPIEAKSA